MISPRYVATIKNISLPAACLAVRSLLKLIMMGLDLTGRSTGSNLIIGLLVSRTSKSNPKEYYAVCRYCVLSVHSGTRAQHALISCGVCLFRDGYRKKQEKTRVWNNTSIAFSPSHGGTRPIRCTVETHPNKFVLHLSRNWCWKTSA